MSNMLQDQSLSEVHQSVDTSTKRKGWRRIFSFFGPAYLVSVGYMDPGNWATDLAGGSQFGYKLIWVLVMSNLMALLLQSLCTRLGIVRKRDLAQCNRETYPKGINFVLYLLAELAIAATDLAEILGMAIGLQLLLGIPLIWGVVITLLDTVLLLYLQRLGIRKMEAFIIALISVIAVCFLIELIMAEPSMGAIASGLKPSIPNTTALYIAIGIIGATVMPHNLYLHSALVQTRKVGTTKQSIKEAIKFNNIDSFIALNLALFVNAAILILAASAFFNTGRNEVASLQEAHTLLEPLLGSKWASHLFAIALIAAGQSSTITGTLSGQIVMEGYLRLRISPVLRRLLTRMIAIVPAVIVILWMGESMVDSMLIFSQVLLSMQLAFAVIPLIYFVSDKEKMGDWAIKPLTKIGAWLIASIIVVLNLKLIYEMGAEWMTDNSIWVKVLIIGVELGLIALLAYVIFFPFFKRKQKQFATVHTPVDSTKIVAHADQKFKTIALALDLSKMDEQVISYALRLGNPETNFVLMHVVESVAAKVFGANASDAETAADQQMLEKYLPIFNSRGNVVTIEIGHNNRVDELVRILQTTEADLVILGSHGHKRLKDLVYGETINSLRHKLHIPVMVVPKQQ